jgi:hypothetical protein
MTTETIKPLTFVRLRVPSLIPPELVEAVKGRTFDVQDFFRYQEMVKGEEGNYLYVLIDEEKKIKGYLWAERNNLDGSLFVNTLSVVKDFWHKGAIMEIVEEFLIDLKEYCKAPRVYWSTQNPKFFEKRKWKRSKNVLMEYNPDKQEKKDGTE